MFVLLHDKFIRTNTMNNKFSYITTMILAATIGLAASCISDDEVDSTSECFINGFAVRDISSTLHTLTSEGIDSTYTLTIGGSSVKFNIDQVNGHIYSVDSLPSWTDLTRVVPSISFSGNLYVMIDSVYYPITGSGDSLNMTRPVEFIVASTDGTSIKHYTAEILLATVNTDSLLWTKLTGSNMQLTEVSRITPFAGKMYAFGSYGNEEALCTSSDGEHWTTPQTLSTDIDTKTVCTLGTQLYATDMDGNINTSADGKNWQASNQTVEHLLGADNFCIYAVKDSKIMATTNLDQWHTAGTKNLENLPHTNVSLATYPTHTNPNLMVDVMVGLNPAQTNAVTWYKVSATEASGSNQQWDYISITSENNYPLPAMSGLTMCHFNNALYATGGTNQYYYRSDDNGITWHQVTRYQFPPQDMRAGVAAATLAWNGYVWMMQATDDGSVNVWRGKLNK